MQTQAKIKEAVEGEFDDIFEAAKDDSYKEATKYTTRFREIMKTIESKLAGRSPDLSIAHPASGRRGQRLVEALVIQTLEVPNIC